MNKIFIVGGARPNFMKIAPIIREIQNNKDSLSFKIIHTGQHYDESMSDSFFRILDIPLPDYKIKVIDQVTQINQITKIMVEYEKIFIKEKPDIVIVVGDVNSTLAISIATKKLGSILCHIEAGLRSKDRSMPEEINRIVTDSIADIFFTTEKNGNENLYKEGHNKNIYYVGNVMIDNLFYQLAKIELSEKIIDEKIISLKKRLKKYICLTLHRPSNVDDYNRLKEIIDEIGSINLPIIFPCHPRTYKNIKNFNLLNIVKEHPNIFLIDPLNYNDFLYLWKDSIAVITDSGGLQEETTALGIPCLTLRENTERPITIDEGTNLLIKDIKNLKYYINQIEINKWKKGRIPLFWDGRASKRIIDIILTL